MRQKTAPSKLTRVHESGSTPMTVIIATSGRRITGKRRWERMSRLRHSQFHPAHYRRGLRQRHVAAGSIFACLFLVACTNQAEPCGEVNAGSEVVFNLSDRLATFGGDAIDVHACVDTTCVDKRISPASGTPGEYIAVPLPAGATAGSVPVSVRGVETHGGQVVIAATGSATLSKLQPNGPSCPPTAFSDRVNVSSDGKLLEEAGPPSPSPSS